jgi:hypothetical protein
MLLRYKVKTVSGFGDPHVALKITPINEESF